MTGNIRYFIGIDGGGTKTRAVLSDSHGRILAKECVGPSNPNDIGLEASCTLISDLISRLISGISPESVSVHAGIAGVINCHDALLSGIRQRHPMLGLVTLDSDVSDIFASELLDAPGVVVICGTGCSCFVKTERQYRRIGGWGWLLDGGGSGFNIGRDALEAVLMQHDGRGRATVLTDLTSARLNMPAWEALTPIYTGGKPLIASFAEDVFTACEAGDAVADAILERNAAFVSDLVRAAYRVFRQDNPQGPMTCVMGGGINQSQDGWITRVKTYLSDIPVDCVKAVRQPVTGAVWLAYFNAQKQNGVTGPDAGRQADAFFSSLENNAVTI